MYSELQKNYHGVKKVIVSSGRYPYPINDYKGELGMSCYNFGIVIESKEEGERLYKAGDPSISRSVRGTSESMEMKYGSSGSAMGSGDPTGILTGTRISEPMFKRQQNIQMAVLGAGAIVGVPLAATAFNQVRKKPLVIEKERINF